MKVIDMTGQSHGYMTVLSFSHTRKGRAFWLCCCVCGIKKSVSGKHLRNGQVTSCGCQKGAKTKYEDYSLRRKELCAANYAAILVSRKKYKERNRERCLSNNRINSSRQRMKRKSLHSEPCWSEKEKIKIVYTKARELGMEVDHIVPLVSDQVCGLHVWHNLQLLNPLENRKKSNKFWPDMYEAETVPNPNPSRLSNSVIQALTT
jgi:hypothetical protein